MENLGQKYAWFLNDKAIVQYNNFEKAKKDLQDSPSKIEINIGSASIVVSKESIYIAPL